VDERTVIKWLPKRATATKCKRNCHKVASHRVAVRWFASTDRVAPTPVKRKVIIIFRYDLLNIPYPADLYVTSQKMKTGKQTYAWIQGKY
jgi:hypothetical protein